MLSEKPIVAVVARLPLSVVCLSALYCYNVLVT